MNDNVKKRLGWIGITIGSIGIVMAIIRLVAERSKRSCLGVAGFNGGGDQFEIVNKKEEVVT